MRRSLFSRTTLGGPALGRAALGIVALGALLTPLTARADQSVYTDSLQNSWGNWSWATVNFSSTSPVHAGADAIAVSSAGYQALYLHHAAFDSTSYGNLVFWINGGTTGGQTLQVAATLSGTAQAAYYLPALAANTWTKVTIPLSSLGVAGTTTLDGFWIQNATGNTLATYYIDDIAFTGGPPPVDPGAITVDASLNRHPINPLIYGVAFADTNSLIDLNAPLNRSGGNGMTTYNWLQNTTNHANDWYFESLPENGTAPGQLVDDFVSSSKAAGAQSAITVPTIGWVAKLGPNRSPLYSFSVAKYGSQKGVDPYHSDAGNGVKTDGTNLTGNDPNDANVPSDVTFQGNWIDHLVTSWGQASKGGVNYYLMDNEPSIWFSTHRDIHPTGPTMDEIYNDIVTYGARVKSADPTAQVAGPEEWGWSGYFYSGYDLQYGNLHGYQNLPDRGAHGGMDYSAWLLQQLAAHDKATGQRILDVFSLHIYPDGNEFGESVDEATQLLRNRSTRELWDPNYTSTSWINDKVMLIPRMKNWVSTYYPGTKIGITEYNWGAEGSINGATAQADIDGIFGREGLDLATRWTTPSPSSPVYTAMKLYRNYDGKKSGFGDTSVSDIAPSADNVSSFASIRSSDGALTVMVINKQLHTNAPLKLTLKNFTPGGPAQTWQVTSANTITHLADTPISSGLLTTTVPLQSITLFVIPAAPQTVALTPIADTYVYSGAYAAKNYGASTSLGVKKYGPVTGNYNRVTYLKFDLSKITTAPKTAVLSLALASADSTIIKAVPCKVYGVANSGWTETGLTWNSAVTSENLNATNVTGTGTYVTTTSVGPKLGTYTWNVSSYLKGKAGQIVTLQIIDESGVGAFCGFNSKEATANKPILTVTY